MVASVSRLLGKTAVTQAVNGGLSKGSIVFLHGTCDTGYGLKSWITRVLNREFKFSEYRVIYPSSPKRPYHLLNGQNATVWFDRVSQGPDMPEDIASINEMGNKLNDLVKQEQETSGISSSKVIVGGFSMGGSMALHLAYRFNRDVAGVFALSSFLPSDSCVFESLQSFIKENPQFEPDDDQRNVTKNGHILEKPKSTVSTNRLPKLFMSHGGRDPLVKSRWSQSTFDQLRIYGTDGHLYTFPNQSHEITKTQLNVLYHWIEEVLSDTPKPKIKDPKPYHLNDENAIPIPFRWPTKR